MKTRFIKIIGKRKTIFKYWESKSPCRHGNWHNTATSVIGTGDNVEFDETDENHLPNIPEVCVFCGKKPNPEDKVHHSRSLGPYFNTASGRPEPGDLWYSEYPPIDHFWDNKKDLNLYCCLPNGVHWNIDSRANNCPWKENRTHRCWKRSGNPEDGTIHVEHGDCPVGAGSIQAGDYHGFLHHGHLNKC